MRATLIENSCDNGLKRRLLFFCGTGTSHGVVHFGLAAQLRAAGWVADIKDWSKQYYVSDFQQEVEQYDYVLTALGGDRILVHSYGIPPEKIIIVAHAEWDIQKMIEAEGVDSFERYAAYGVVSDLLACSSIALGIKRVPAVVRLGVNYPKYRRDISPALTSVGYAATMSRPTVYGVEGKRGSLAKACAEAAGLRFAAVDNLPFDAMPDFYGSVDSVVMPSLQEGAGLPPLEGAAAGRLVIGTPVGHFPRLAYEGLGILAPLNAEPFQRFTTETLIYYRDNPSAYAEKCAAIQDAARQRDWQYVVKDWVEFFNSALVEPPADPATLIDRRPMPKHRAYESYLEELTAKHEDVFFLEVGAADGKSFDSLYPFALRNNWSGLLVEPNPELFEKLRQNYRSCSKVKFERVAISDKFEIRELYSVPLEVVDSGNAPDWALGISSFYQDRNAIGGRGIGEDAYLAIKDHVRRLEVSCVPLMSLIDKYHIDAIDIIQIDTEGHDYHVLRQIDFARLMPKLIYFESTNLPEDELHAATRLLAQHRYICIDYGYNILAVRSETGPTDVPTSEGRG
jgi:FkbM family methyltransferase